MVAGCESCCSLVKQLEKDKTELQRRIDICITSFGELKQIFIEKGMPQVAPDFDEVIAELKGD